MGQPTGLAQIPDKTYFKIGEVCELTAIKSHTLRYWESEFSVIRPHRAGSQQRLYRRIDIENILQIKALIYDQGMTLAGVKKILAKPLKLPTTQCVRGKNSTEILKTIKEELLVLKKMLP